MYGDLSLLDRQFFSGKGLGDTLKVTQKNQGVLRLFLNLNYNPLTHTGYILISNDIAGMIAALFLANYCSARKIRWMGIGAVLAAIASILPTIATLLVEVSLKLNIKPVIL